MSETGARPRSADYGRWQKCRLLPVVSCIAYPVRALIQVVECTRLTVGYALDPTRAAQTGLLGSPNRWLPPGTGQAPPGTGLAGRSFAALAANSPGMSRRFLRLWLLVPGRTSRRRTGGVCSGPGRFMTPASRASGGIRQIAGGTDSLHCICAAKQYSAAGGSRVIRSGGRQ